MDSLRLALLNTGRNRRRTLLLLALVAAGTAGLIVNDGLISFIFDGLRDDAIYGRFGHLQVYTRGYQQHHRQDPAAFWMAEAQYHGLRQRLLAIPHVRMVTSELTVPALIVAGDRTATGIALGGEPGQEQWFAAVRLLDSAPGSADHAGDRDVWLGRGMAERLHARPGDVVTVFAMLPDRSYNALDVRVAGIFEEGFRDYDDWSLKVPLPVLQQLTGDRVVEKVIVFLDDTRQTAATRFAVERFIEAEKLHLESASWLELAEFYRQVIAMFGRELQVIMWILQAVSMTAVLLVISMAFTERRREMATLLSQGMTRFHLASLFVAEGFWLGVAGGVAGACCGLLVAHLLSAVGIPMPPPPGSTRPFTARVSLYPGHVFEYSMVSLAACLLGSVFPALWVWKLDIAQALRPEEG